MISPKPQPQKRKAARRATEEVVGHSLRQFILSPRGQMMAETRVGAVIGSRSRKLSAIPWSQLLTILPELPQKELKKIFDFLSVHVPIDVQTIAYSDEDLEPIRKSDAQGKLEEAFQQLKRLQSTELNRYTLKDFFDSDGPSAPFEEGLSFKQFIELGLENVIRKRGTTAEKLNAFAEAIKRFIAHLQVNAAAQTQSDKPQTQTLAETPAVIRFNAEKDLSHCPIGKVLLAGFTNLLSPGFLREIITQLASLLTEEDMLCLLLKDAHGLLHYDAKQCAEVTLQAYRKIDALLQARYPHIREGLRMLLISPGAPITVFQGMISGHHPPTASDSLLTSILLLSIGARHPSVQEKNLTHLYTNDPKLGAKLIESLKSSSDSVSELHAHLPHFPIELLSAMLTKS